MTPLKCHKDGFFSPPPTLPFINDRFILPKSLPLSPCLSLDAFENNRFNAQFLSQIGQLRLKQSAMQKELTALKNDEAGQKKRQALMLQYKALQERHKLLTLIAEHMEKTSQLIASNFR